MADRVAEERSDPPGDAMTYGPWRQTAVGFHGRWGLGLVVAWVRFANDRTD